jgi:hypothetical protein
MIVMSEGGTIKSVLALAVAMASVINCDHKWHLTLEHHLLTTLEESFTMVICL